jgi:hypothetical protein
MTLVKHVLPALVAVALFVVPMAAFAAGGHAINPQRKQQSDANIQAGLSQLQSAASALQSGGGSGVVGTLTTAYQDLKQALPIYHGYREKAMGATNHAIKALQRNGKQSVSRASADVGKAIADAQQALQTN